MSVQIVLFEQSHILEAAALLAARHQRDRASLPDLPAQFEDVEAAWLAIETTLQRKYTLGFAALADGRLQAYLIGSMVIDNLCGRSGWVNSAGCAYNPQAGVEIVRDLYARLGEHWVAYGIFFHFALILVADPDLVQAWFSLAFGIEQVHALLDLQRLDPALPELPEGVTIRKALPDDRHHLVEM